MRKLKFWTTTLLTFGLLMLLGTPFLLMARPGKEATDRERLVFAATVMTYSMILLIVFFIVAVLAWRLIVKQREEYASAHLDNLKDLVEGSLEDHKKKAEE